MNTSALLAVLPLLISGTAAFAEATEEGAAGLREVFQTYLGTTEGVVTVDLAGDDYRVTLDAAPFAASVADTGASFSLTPLVMTVTDQGDGTWGVTMDQPLGLTFTAPGQAEVREQVGAMTYEGVFDPALMSFTSAHAELTDFKVNQVITDPNLGDMTVEAGFASSTYDLKGTAAATGGVDTTITSTAEGFYETFMTPGTDGMPPMPVQVTVESMAQNTEMSGLRPDAVFKTLAWVVANPSEMAMAANKGALKSILLEGLPLFDMIAGDMTLKNIAATTPMGDLGIAEVGVTVGLTGAVPEGRLREAITLSGLTLPSGVVPDWALPILPQAIKIDFEIRDFDAAAGFTALLDILDLPFGAKPDEAMGARIGAAFLPNNAITIGLYPGHVAGEGYELTYEGEMSVDMELPIPTGKAVVTLSGIEVLQAAIEAAPPEMQMQAMMSLGMAEGMAKPGANGELVWEIDASMPGNVMINGMPMMGGQ